MQAALATVREGKTINLAGNLQLYSPDTKEPGKPMYLSIYTAVDTTKPSKVGDAAPAEAVSQPAAELIATPMVYPNPFVSQLNLSFILDAESACSVSICSVNGTKVYEEPMGKLPSGNHRYQIQLNLTPGSYTVRLVYGEKVYTSLIIKK